jgi:hypothetical protein
MALKAVRNRENYFVAYFPPSGRKRQKFRGVMRCAETETDQFPNNNTLKDLRFSQR